MFHFRQRATRSFSFDARALVTTIAWLRPCAATGQVLAIAVAVGWLRIALPLVPLAAGIAALVLAAAGAFLRVRNAKPVGEAEAFGHVAFDKLFAIIGLHGGATVFNVYVIGVLVPCLIGVVPYLALRRSGTLPTADVAPEP